jgi:lysophospholipase L1-like esterase
MNEFRPVHTLLMLATVFLMLGGIIFIFPKSGIQLGDGFSLNYPEWKDILPSAPEEKKDISSILQLAEEEDKMDSLGLRKLEIPKLNDSLSDVKKIENLKVDSAVNRLVTSIQFKDGKKGALDRFFLALHSLVDKKQVVRVLHYGDSQIEGDRMTEYLRSKLQNQFGGSGPGIISAAPVAQSIAIRQKWSENFDRYNAFVGKDARVKHNNFGVMAGFCRFAPYSSVSDSTSLTSAYLQITTNKNGGAALASYSKVKLYYGGAKTKTKVEFFDGGKLTNEDSLQTGGMFNTKTWSVSTPAPKFEIKFSGTDSPDIYGLSLEGENGIMVDNFGLRGSSGTFFSQMNSAQLKQFYDQLNVQLIILQFGGNALPGMKDSTGTRWFGRRLKAQIDVIRKILPSVSILVIGPSDMSVADGTTFVTHPQLENLRNAIRDAAFETGCAFWDMYEVMGGKNSMVEWVKLNLAATDYIHFAPGGARKVSTLLYSALIKEYENYLQHLIVN